MADLRELITVLRPCPVATGPALRITPRLRVYVACSRGNHGLVDDRDTLAPERRCQVDIIEAEYVDPAAVTPEDRLARRVPCPSECKG